MCDSRSSSVGLQVRQSFFDSWQGLGRSLSLRHSIHTTQPAIQWVRGPLSPGVKRLGSEAEHSPPSSAEIKNAWSYTSSPTRLHGAVLS